MKPQQSQKETPHWWSVEEGNSCCAVRRQQGERTVAGEGVVLSINRKGV